MQYNSMDDFFSAHKDAIVALMEAAQRAAGGHYAALTPEQLHQNAANDTETVFAVLRVPFVDSQGQQASARETEARGIDLDDLTRMGMEFEDRFVPFIEEQLAATHPALCQDLVTRFRQRVTRFRTSVTTVKIDIDSRQRAKKP